MTKALKKQTMNSIEKKNHPYRSQNRESLPFATRRLESHPDIPESETPKWRQMMKWVQELPQNIQSSLDGFLYERRETSPTTKEAYYAAILEHEFKLPTDPMTQLSPSNNPQYEKFLLNKVRANGHSPLQKKQHALVFVPHADDIAYSMGAFMTDLKDKYGDQIEFDFVIGTDGAAGFSPADQKQYTTLERKKIRQYEQIREAIELGAASIAFFNYPDGQLDQVHNQAERDLIREIQLTQPTYVFSYAPHYDQKNSQKNIMSTNIEHVDHLINGQIVQSAIKKSGMRTSVPIQDSFRQLHRPHYWFQFGYDQSVTPQTNFVYQPTSTTFTKKLSAFAKNKSQIMINWQLSAELNGLHYLMRVNREVDKNNRNLSENFIVQEVTKMAV